MPIQMAQEIGTEAATSRAGCPVPSNTCSLPMSHSVRKPSPEVLQEVWPAALHASGPEGAVPASGTWD